MGLILQKTYFHIILLLDEIIQILDNMVDATYTWWGMKRAPQILRCAQDDIPAGWHPERVSRSPERSEGEGSRAGF